MTQTANSARTHELILTEREVKVLSLILEGKSSREAARLLFVSERTVDLHLARIYQKIHVVMRAQPIRPAAEFGVVDPAMQTFS